MRLLLVENGFSELSSFLQTHGYYVERASFSAFFDMLKVGQDYNYILLHVEDKLDESAELIVSYCNNNNLPLVTVSSCLSEEISVSLKNHGAALFLTIEEILKDSQIFRFSAGYDDIEKLHIIHLNDDRPSHKIIQTMCSEYAISYTRVETDSALFDVIDELTDIVLVNIESTSFNVHQFLNRALYSREFLKTVFIPFSISGDISITDINSGLNRIAKIFLNRDELFNFLIRHFHGRELVCAMHTLKEFADKYCEDGCLLKSSLQLYHEKGDKFFADSFSLDEAYFEGMRERSLRLSGVGGKLRFFRWLLQDPNKAITCGTSVYI
ncbi:MAG: hypothetical protein PF637_04685 [Spirochaetes bacterium]|jgi:hypothetical protein|nr:hypothetical protein [Spirochaetota bacterium]